uniref:Uncharacterized protein n=1 Tax=Sus scrofa TaxID=9823 RepID=A0A8D1DY80_PIG
MSCGVGGRCGSDLAFCTSHFSRGSESMALQVLRALEGLKMMGKDQDRGLKVIPQTQRDLDRITRQVITAKKH